MPITLNQITCYPVKSLAGINCQSSVVEARGLRHDRRWMVVTPDGQFLTQRELPRMALVSPKIGTDWLQLAAPGMPLLHVPLTMPDGTDELDVRVWRSVCRAQIVSTDADAWLSAFLETACRLVFMPDATRRAVNPEFTAGEGIVSFADGYPVLLLSEASVADVNRRQEKPALTNRFRPNLVVTGTDAFAEDEWRRVKIGDVVFVVVKPCERCALTTIAQETGLRDGPEPLQTLAAYRKRDGKVLFGQYLVAENEGTVTAGDAVTVLA